MTNNSSNIHNYPKSIKLVSWKQQKIENALSQVTNIKNDYIDELIFKIVVDYCRKNYGFPNADELDKIIAIEPVKPTDSNDVKYEIQPQDKETRVAKCPICETSHDSRLFTNHIETCSKNLTEQDKLLRLQKMVNG